MSSQARSNALLDPMALNSELLTDLTEEDNSLLIFDDLVIT